MVIDVPKAMEERGLKASEIVMEDGLHLTSLGNAVYAEIIAGSLKTILDAFDACL